MKRLGSHLLSFSLGVLVGVLAAQKGCPPVPVPADQEPPPASAPPVVPDAPAPGAK